MKVDAIRISNFRSVSSGELESCGGFNVLIGKNNSGKSNILAAIDAFFVAVRNGEIITLNSPINKEFDFYRKNSDSPAEVSITFSLEEEDISELKDSIIEDSPQLTNAVGDLDSDLRLNVQISFNLRPRTYACVSKISLTPPNDRSNSVESEKILLSMDKGAAASLENTHRQFQNLERRITEIGELLNSIERDDWARLRRDEGSHSPLSAERLLQVWRTPTDNFRTLKDASQK